VRGGIWRFLTAEQHAEVEDFLQRYQTVRTAEGWGTDDASYYRALPEVPAGDPHRAVWRERARAFQAFRDHVLTCFESELGRPLQILDLGAGNGWLAHRLAARGHTVAAVDLSDHPTDGLGAWCNYGESRFTPVQASFDCLPFADGQADLVVFNASLHHSVDLSQTLGEALRVLRAGGRVVILDSPFYTAATHGERMVCERDGQFARDYGFRGPTRAAAGFLTPDRLANLAALWSIRWQQIWPTPWWRRAWRRQVGRLRLGREPATFPIVVGQQLPLTVQGIIPDAARLGLRLRYRLFQRRRQRDVVIESVAGFSIRVSPGVFNPRQFRTGEFLAEVAGQLVPAGARVLDLGTGTGIGALAASRRAASVLAVDVNPEAVGCARLNLALNRQQAAFEVVQGNLFEPVGEQRFDVVLFNPPFFRGEPKDLADRAWHSPDIAERFAKELADHLTASGFGVVVLSTDGDVAGFLRAFRQAGCRQIELAASRRYLNETLLAYRLRPGGYR
jgi:methylase of polypeptide subunit release factors